MSACGNFAIVGYATGKVEKFNVQSGLHRGSFGKRSHGSAVRGVACDALNRIVATAGHDGYVKTWDFAKCKLRWKTSMGSPVVSAELHRESGLLAVACQDYTVFVVDIEGQRVVRTFNGHSNRVTDIGWSPDGRWLISSSMDNTIRVWDVPTGCPISRLRVASAATSVAFSPTADYLATTHVDQLGIYLWVNSSMYTDASIKPLGVVSDDETEDVASLPSTRGAGAVTADEGHFEAQLEDEADVDDDEATDDDGEAVAAAASDADAGGPMQLDSSLVTLSAVPKSHWANLSNLTEIKQRNKPKEPPKAPKAAPFFIPTKDGLTTEFAFEDEAPELPEGSSRVLNFGKIGAMSPFQKALTRAGEMEEYATFGDTLKTLTPAQIDLELRSLTAEDDLAQLRYFLGFIAHQLKSKQDFELTQAYLHLFLKVHGDMLRGSDEAAAMLRETLDEHEMCWVHLEGLFQHALSTINFLKGQV